MMIGEARMRSVFPQGLLLLLAGWNELLIASFSHRSVSVQDGILLATGLHVHRSSAHSAGVGSIFDRWLSSASSACVCASVPVCACACLCECACACVRACACARLCLCARVPVHACLCMCARVPVRVRVCQVPWACGCVDLWAALGRRMVHPHICTGQEAETMEHIGT